MAHARLTVSIGMHETIILNYTTENFFIEISKRHPEAQLAFVEDTYINLVSVDQIIDNSIWIPKFCIS